MADPTNVPKVGQQTNPQIPPQSHSSTPSSSSISIVPTGEPAGSCTPSPKHVTSPPSGSSSGRHPVYRGIRSRSGKWVSEIREPRKTTRIWLGTYPTPEMAAAAYDVAALALKDPARVSLNFPNSSILPYSVPQSPTAAQIRFAAANAAASRAPKPEDTGGSSTVAPPLPPPESTLTKSNKSAGENENEITFIDEEALFDIPNLLVEMAEGMLLSPPRMMKSQPSDDTPDDSDGESLWSY